MSFQTFRQHDSMDCGPTCLRMVSKFYGKDYPLDHLRKLSNITREGVSIAGISEAAEELGFKTFSAKLTFELLDEQTILPCILHWNNNHFVVIPPQNYDRNKKRDKILVADPAHGLMRIDKATFLKCWQGSENTEGVALMLEPTEEFYKIKENYEKNRRQKGLLFFLKYFIPYKKYIVQLLCSMLLGSLLSLVFPFLTQLLVDRGIGQRNLSFVYLVLISQLFLFTGSTIIEMIRNWVVLHMNTRVNIKIISDFLIKLMKLPIRFFDIKMMGDIQQRIADHQRVQSFLTGTTLSTIFSFTNLIIFVGILTAYSWKIICVFFIFSTFSTIWILFFLKKRKEIDYARFQSSSENQNVMYELITGMQEIKLNNCETEKRKDWEKAQANIYKVSIQGMALGQYQEMGSFIFTQLKNIFISYITAKEVITGNMSLGMMMSVSYIVGQLNGPIGQLLGLTQAVQDAKLSLDRISEIHSKEDEEPIDPVTKKSTLLSYGAGWEGADIRLKNISFRYAGKQSPFVLQDIDLVIPKGKVTAIVGTSGSGKTTLLKLLLKFYEPTSGELAIGDTNLNGISPRWWRNQCGSVMQDGYIFSDTMAKNIAVKENEMDMERVAKAAEIANIREFIENMPLKYNTKIGNTGNGISSGQKQRILIARAVYKNPSYLFFDEATSSLDTNNERIIMNNLDEFFVNKTVVVIAHRLSTVKHADQIIVLEKGKIVEVGTHANLSLKKGNYYELIRNQLELGN